MSEKQQYWVVIPAAGVGKRMQADRPKQYLPLAGHTVLEHTIKLFTSHDSIRGVAIALDSNDSYWAELKFPGKDRLIVVNGGAERCHSVLNGLKALANIASDDAWMLVHDAARPCLPLNDLNRLMSELAGDDTGGILALPVNDTLKCSIDKTHVDETVDRQTFWRALTPQMFRLSALQYALESCLERGFQVTDEASAMEQAGFRPRLIQGQARNIKITQPEDLALAEFYLSSSA